MMVPTGTGSGSERRRRRRDGRTLVPTTSSDDHDDDGDDDDDEGHDGNDDDEYSRRRPGRISSSSSTKGRSSSPLRGMIRHRHHPSTTTTTTTTAQANYHHNHTPSLSSSDDHRSRSSSRRRNTEDNNNNNNNNNSDHINPAAIIPRVIYLLVGCAAWNSAILGYDAGVSSLSVLMVQTTLDLSDFQISIYLGMLNLCAMVGSLVASYINERYGRRGCFVVTSVGFILGDIIQASAQSFTTLIVGRSLLGFSIGQGLAIDPIYISEISPRNVRGFLVSWSEIAINLGWIFGFASGILFYQVPDNLAWRYMYTCGAILPITMLLLVKWYMPESPRWLLSKGHDDEARRVLKRLYFDDGTVTTVTTTTGNINNTSNAFQSPEDDHDLDGYDNDEDTGIVGTSHLQPPPQTKPQLIAAPSGSPSTSNPRTSHNGIASTTTATTTLKTEGEGEDDDVDNDDEVETMMNDIKVALRHEQANAGQELGWSFLLCRPTPAYRRMLLAGFIAGISQQVVGIEGINSFETFVLDQSGIHDRYWQAMTLVFIQIIKSFVTIGSSRLVDTWGRRALSFISIGGIVISLLVLAVDFHLSSGATSNLAIVGLLGYMVSFAAGMGPVAWLIPSEVFTTSLRSKGMAITIFANRAVSTMMSSTFLELEKVISWSGVFLVLAGLSTTMAGLIYWFVPETKGRSLEDMAVFFATITGDRSVLDNLDDDENENIITSSEVDTSCGILNDNGDDGRSGVLKINNEPRKHDEGTTEEPDVTIELGTMT